MAINMYEYTEPLVYPSATIFVVGFFTFCLLDSIMEERFFQTLPNFCNFNRMDTVQVASKEPLNCQVLRSRSYGFP